uniref:Transcription elongation factor 1 homolog n=1 Tax=Timema bartmani TaxID=61472 RepID=A0A7R9F4C5_9NEOP|nr:unnamed protein product [Timema bartmani]
MHGGKVENHFGKTTLSTPDQDSNLDLPVIGKAMGRRKSKRKPPAKRKAIEPLDLQFNCPFCNHEKSCEVKM